MQLLDSSGVVLRSATFDSPSAGSSVSTVFAASGMPKTMSGAGSGTIVTARYRTSGGSDWSTGATVGVPGSGAQVIVDVTEGPNAGTLVVGATDTVLLIAATLTYGAG